MDIASKIQSDSAWIGFTAATGGLCQEHLILRWLLLRKPHVSKKKEAEVVKGKEEEANDDDEARMLAEALALSMKS